MTENSRKAETERKTGETQVSVSLNLDGSGKSDIKTGVGFLNHMLELLSKHSGFDIQVSANGDLDVDAHHTTEDVGIVLGETFREAIGDKAGIARFADVSLPMQDSLANIAVDICGRPYLAYNVKFPVDKIGEFDTELVEEFINAFVTHARITMHVECVTGINSHHIAEAVFKAVARVLKAACAISPGDQKTIPSTKGSL